MALTIKGGQEPGRNEPCPCGSGLKMKHCHGDPGKKAICEAVVREHMLILIKQEQLKRGLITQEEYDEFMKVEEDDGGESDI